MFTHTMLKSQGEALINGLKLRVHNWDKIEGHQILTDGSGRNQTVVGSVWPVPRQPNYDEDQVRVFLDRKTVMGAFEEKVRASIDKKGDPVGLWGAVTEWGKYGPVKIVEYVLEQIQQGE
jgi:hypothetical protein